jgi:hypothetical protein
MGGQVVVTAAPTRRTKLKEQLGWLVACASMLALISFAIWSRSSKPTERVAQFYASVSFPARDISIAPNGHTIAMIAYLQSARKNALWIYELGFFGARSLADTEGASYPFWSADGRFVGCRMYLDTHCIFAVTNVFIPIRTLHISQLVDGMLHRGSVCECC